MASTPKKPGQITGPSGSTPITQKVNSFNRWREQYNPLRGLTLPRAVSMAEAFFRGEMADYQWACFFIEQTDPDLFALLEMRNGRIVEMNWDFTPEKGADAALVKRQTDLLTEKFALIDNISEAIEHLALAPFRGFSHCEKWYEAGELVHLEPVDQWNVCRDGLRGPWRYNPRADSTTYAALGTAADMPPEQFLYREVRRHINRIALFKFIRANLSEKDWDAFVEIYGIPGGVLIGPPNLAIDKTDEFRHAAEAIAEGGSGFAPYGSTWVPNTAARGTQPFKERLDHLSEKLVLVGTGGKLTMLTEAGSGTLAGGAHKDVFDQIAAAEAVRISECFNTQIVGPMIETAFPGEKCAVYFRLCANEETDTGAAVDEVQKLSAAGYQCDPDEVAERTGWKVTLKPAAPASPYGFQGGQLPLVRNRAAIRNSADLAAAGRDAAFRAHAIEQLSRAQSASLAPLVTRLERIAALPDADFDAGLKQLKAELPSLYRTVLSDPAVAAAWEEILGAAIVSGAASAAQSKKQ